MPKPTLSLRLNEFTEKKLRRLKKHGSYQFETADTKGNVVFRANGVIHDFSPNQKITRTFEMENTPFGVQLELLEFEQLTSDTSKLKMHIIYESVAQRNQLLQLPFTQGINMAHNRLQDIGSKLKQEISTTSLPS